MDSSGQRIFHPQLQPLLDNHHNASTAHSDSESASTAASVPSTQPPLSKWKLQRSKSSKEDADRPRAQSLAVPLMWRLPALAIAVLAAGLASSLLAWLIVKQYHGEGGGVLRTGRWWALTLLEPAEGGNGSPEGTVFVGLIISSIIVSIYT